MNFQLNMKRMNLNRINTFSILNLFVTSDDRVFCGQDIPMLHQNNYHFLPLTEAASK